VTTDQLDRWTEIFVERYHDEIRTTIKKQAKRLIKKVKKSLDKGKLDRITILVAEIDYLNKCLEHVTDLQWNRSYLKVCLQQFYQIEEYPSTTGWTEFFKNHAEEQEEALYNAKLMFVNKLTHR